MWHAVQINRDRKRMDFDDDDEDVPQLVTLDQHLSNELGAKLKSGFSNVEERSAVVDKDSRKVPITILTGTFQITDQAKKRIPGGWEDDIAELYLE